MWLNDAPIGEEFRLTDLYSTNFYTRWARCLLSTMNSARAKITLETPLVMLGIVLVFEQEIALEGCCWDSDPTAYIPLERRDVAGVEALPCV
jgi:hypothetical protein